MKIYFEQIKYNKVPDTTVIFYSPAPVFIFALFGNDH